MKNNLKICYPKDEHVIEFIKIMIQIMLENYQVILISPE